MSKKFFNKKSIPESEIFDRNDPPQGNLDDYHEIISEHRDNAAVSCRRAYNQYLEEKINSTIQYTEYLAEQLDRSIQYTEYIANNINNIRGYAGTSGYSSWCGTPGQSGTSGGFIGISGSSGISRPLKKKEYKRVYSEMDPYGEEDWDN